MIPIPVEKIDYINLTRLARIGQSTTESRVAVLRDGTELPISRTGHARLRELL